MQRLLREALEVVVNGELTPGCIIYCLTHPATDPTTTEIPLCRGLRTSGLWTLRGSGWLIPMVHFEAEEWPADHDVWSAWVRDVFQALLAAGARATWLGGEGFPVADPPHLFGEQFMSGGVLAWAAGAEVSVIPRLDEWCVPVGDPDLRRLRDLTSGLSC